MRSNRPYVQIDPDVLERARQIDLLSYLREFEPSNLVKVKGTIAAHVHMYEYFGGVAKILVPDNCRTAVDHNKG